MQRSFTYTLLITCVLFVSSCKTHYLPSSIEAQNITVSDSLEVLDEQIIQIYSPYKALLEKDMNRVISVAKMEMTKGKPESYLTNFLGDLLLYEGEKIASVNEMSLSPSISYFNYGGIRTFLPKGEITVGKIYELMPFENEMVYIQLTGKQIQIFLNQIAAKGGDSVGGVRFVISEERAKNITIDGELLDTEKRYWLVTNDYVANGGDGLEVFTQRLDFVGTGKKIRDIIISYLEEKQKSGEMITAKLDSRIKNE